MNRPADIPHETYERAVTLCRRFRNASNQEELVARVLMALDTKPGRAGLTNQQAAALKFIERYQDEHQAGPTYDEIKDALGLASKSGVHRLVHALIERGALNALPSRWRSVSIRRAA
ncbi:LexA family protein [Devosia submarina]|uniref:LexA family protein n=1 Tax=Devosia submarina TaxID=1173082 RepID=UPI001AECCFAA|nr:hypothetical protein [Devosia submarina]